VSRRSDEAALEALLVAAAEEGRLDEVLPPTPRGAAYRATVAEVTRRVAAWLAEPADAGPAPGEDEAASNGRVDDATGLPSIVPPTHRRRPPSPWLVAAAAVAVVLAGLAALVVERDIDSVTTQPGPTSVPTTVAESPLVCQPLKGSLAFSPGLASELQAHQVVAHAGLVCSEDVARRTGQLTIRGEVNVGLGTVPDGRLGTLTGTIAWSDGSTSDVTVDVVSDPSLGVDVAVTGGRYAGRQATADLTPTLGASPPILTTTFETSAITFAPPT
jgi:hypothetical protein